MTVMNQQIPYQRQPIKRTLRALGRGLLWVDRLASKHRIKPFALAFIGAALVLSGGAYVASPWAELIVNKSNSLPGVLFLLDKTTPPQCGDTTVIDMPVEGRFYRGSRLIKIIKGCGGDVITHDGRETFINHHSVGVAMETSTDGKHVLTVIPDSTIPDNKVYLAATHHQSYDSRYASFGLRDRRELLGTAIRLF
jgi:conjugal transfer pilin signal peptidase TrbI